MGALARFAVMANPQPDPQSPASGLLVELWREQSLWSRTADRMKRRIDAARRIALVLVVVVAALATAGGTMAGSVPGACRTPIRSRQTRRPRFLARRRTGDLGLRLVIGGEEIIARR